MSPPARYGLEVGMAVPFGMTTHVRGQVGVDALKDRVDAIPGFVVTDECGKLRVIERCCRG